MKRLTLSVAAGVACLSSPSAAQQLPDPVRAMIEAAIARGDKAQIEAVVAVARETQPEAREEINKLYVSWAEAQEEEKRDAAAADAEGSGEGSNWTAKAELGAFRATGGSDDLGVAVALSTEYEGEDWTHKFTGRVDYQEANGAITREQLFAAYEPRYIINDRLFIYGLGQIERDRVQGFAARYVLSGGAGYRVIDREDLDFSIKAGPALRVIRFIDGGRNTKLAGLLGLDFEWRISDRLTFTQDTNAVAETGGSALLVVDGANTSLNLVTGLEAKISERLSTRITYQVEYDSNPPEGGVKTDTLTRFTLVYGF